MQNLANTIVCAPNVAEIGDFICKMGLLIKAAIPLLVALGVLYFVWGVVTYVIGGADDEAKKKGRDRIVFGIIGLSVIIGVWALVSFVLNTFNLTVPSSGINYVNPVDVLVAQPQSQSYATCIYAVNPRLQDLLRYISCIISNSVIPLVFAIALVSFIYGVVQYVINDSDEGKKDRGRQFMVWGIIALAVMVSVWGLVRIFTTTFNIDFGVPQLQQRP